MELCVPGDFCSWVIVYDGVLCCIYLVLGSNSILVSRPFHGLERTLPLMSSDQESKLWNLGTIFLIDEIDGDCVSCYICLALGSKSMLDSLAFDNIE